MSASNKLVAWLFFVFDTILVKDEILIIILPYCTQYYSKLTFKL